MLDSGARGSTTTFAQRGLGDVLLSWENEAWLALDELGRDKVEIVTPPSSILAEPPVSVVDKVVDHRGTRAVSQAYLEGLYSLPGQEVIAKNFLSPAREGHLRQIRPPVPQHPHVQHPRPRRLDQGAADPLRRRRRVRPDLYKPKA